jgi:cysteine desulfurase
MFWSNLRKKRAYFDYASTTPLDPEVFDAMEPYLTKNFANPSSLYKEGVMAKKAIEEARKKVAGVLQSKTEEIIFTGGGTEANNMAILGTYFYHKNVLKKEKIHFVTTSIEHSSVIEAFEHLRSLGAKVTYVSPEENGMVSVKKIEEALRPETVLVSVMYANNEIGTIQPIREIAKVVCKMGIFLHSDACQAGSYLSLLMHDLQVDLLTLDGSKIYGPKGTGVLFKKRSVMISPLTFGGGQENGIRSGTESVAGIVGFAEALTIAQREKAAEGKRVYAMRNRLLNELISRIPTLKVNGDLEKRLPNNINICIPGLDAEYAVLRLDALGYAVSSVTSCKNLSEDSSSYVIEELYKDQSCSKSSLRITLGRYTTETEVQGLIKNLLTVLQKQYNGREPSDT